MNVEQLEPRCLLSGSAVRREIMPEATLAPATTSPLVVNTLADETNPNDGLLSLREAIAQAQTSAQPITFDPSAAGGTITLIGSNGPIQISTATTISNSTTGAINIAAGTGAFLEVSSGGSLQLSNVSLIGTSPVLQLDMGGAAALTNVPDSAPISDNGSLTDSLSHAVTWSGAISGAGSVSVNGSQTLALTGTNTYTGGTTVVSSDVVGNTLTLQGSISGTGVGGALVMDQSLGTTSTGAFLGTVSGALSLTISNGIVELPPGSSFTNTLPTSVKSGATLLTGASNQLSGGSDLVVNGTLDLSGNDQTIPSLAGSGTISTSQRGPSGITTILIDGSSSGATFSGVIEDHFPQAQNPTGVVAVQKTNSATQVFSGANTYSGGTTIDAGSLAALSSPNDPLGSGPVFMNNATLDLAGQTLAPAQQVIPVSGFNQDVVVEAAATNPVAATTVAFDDSVQYPPLTDFYEEGFGGSAAAGTGLPPSGSTFTSLSNPTVRFQMQPYNQDNVLLLNTVGSSGTLRLVQPAPFGTINLLASGAYGGANLNVTMDFADGSTTTFPIFVPDWISTDPAAVIAGGRVLRSSTISIANYGNNPRIYEYDLTLPLEDEAKSLDAVTFTVTQGGANNGNVVGIFALSGQSVQIVPQQTYPNPLFVTGDSTLDIRNSPSAFMGALTITNGTLSVTGDPGSTAQFSAVTVNGGNLSLAPAAGTSVTLRNISAPASSLVVSGSGAVLLAGSNSYASTAVTSGTLAVFGASGLPSNTPLNVGSAGHVSLVSSGNPFTVTVSTLQLSGTMDVTTNGVQIAYTSSDPVAAIGSMIASGHLYSSRSDADHAVGYLDTASALTPAIGSNSIEVKYTLLGDTDLDGSVTLSDLLNLTRHFGQNAGWSGGDFNYNGKVDLSDFLSLARHFGQSMAVASTTSAVASMASLAPDPLDDSDARRKRRV